eukprot:333326-Chlamydomonas_euryale.AAC.3
MLPANTAPFQAPQLVPPNTIAIPKTTTAKLMTPKACSCYAPAAARRPQCLGHAAAESAAASWRAHRRTHFPQGVQAGGQTRPHRPHQGLQRWQAAGVHRAWLVSVNQALPHQSASGPARRRCLVEEQRKAQGQRGGAPLEVWIWRCGPRPPRRRDDHCSKTARRLQRQRHHCHQPRGCSSDPSSWP